MSRRCYHCGPDYPEYETKPEGYKKEHAEYEKPGYEKPCCHEKKEECECEKKPVHKCNLPYEAVKEMRAAIDDELGAMAEYATLARKLKCNPVMQAWVTNIAGDEYGHARAFYMALAGAGCIPCKEWEDD